MSTKRCPGAGISACRSTGTCEEVAIMGALAATCLLPPHRASGSAGFTAQKRPTLSPENREVHGRPTGRLAEGIRRVCRPYYSLGRTRKLGWQPGYTQTSIIPSTRVRPEPPARVVPICRRRRIHQPISRIWRPVNRMPMIRVSSR